MSFEFVNPAENIIPSEATWNINVIYHSVEPACFDHVEHKNILETGLDAVELFSQFTANIINEMSVFTR